MTDHDPTPQERELAEHGRTLAAIAAHERAPLALRERIEAQQASARRRRRTVARVLAPAAGLAAVIAAVVVLAPGTGTNAPTIAAVAGLTLAGHERPAPAQAPGNPRALDEAVERVAFPSWSARFAWHATGERDDTIAGRQTRTVFYTSPKGIEIGYSIVAGRALAIPRGPHHAVAGVSFVVMRNDGRQTLTWRRDGHTCVISAPAAAPTAKLLELAAWKGADAVRS